LDLDLDSDPESESGAAAVNALNGGFSNGLAAPSDSGS
jgi:hypothetical protein